MKTARKKILFFAFAIIFGISGLTATSPVRADQSLLDSQIGLSETADVYGKSSAPEDIRITIAKIINIILGFLGIIFVVLTIVAGFQYMTAGGNEEKTKKALGLIKNAVIGLVVILMSWMITRFIVRQLSRAANNSVDYTTYSPY